MDFMQYALKGTITAIVELIIYWTFFTGIFDKKRKGWKNGLKLFAFYISIITTSYFALPATFKLLLLIIIGCLIAKMIFDASWKNIIIYNFIWVLCSLIGECIAIGILSISNWRVNINELLSNDALFLQGVILSKTICFIIIIIFVKKFGKESNRYSLSEMLIMMLQGISGVACLLLVIEFTYYRISTYKVVSVYLIFIAILILAAYFVFYRVFESYIKKKNIEQEALKVKFYNKGQYEYYSTLEEENLNVRKMYHDIKNHLLAIKGLNNENSDLAEAYIQECLDTVEGSNQYYDTGNKLADIILYEKNNIARMNQIETKILIQKNSLNGIDMIDLCAILTNSFDNSIEACKLCKKERRIQVKSIKNEASLILTFKNNYEIEPIKRDNGTLITHKNNKMEHGLGMQSVKAAVKKYNGNVEISIDQTEKEFLLIIMIPNAFKL
jgi:hypothetical protein